jgi:hypothetical protein
VPHSIEPVTPRLAATFTFPATFICSQSSVPQRLKACSTVLRGPLPWPALREQSGNSSSVSMPGDALDPLKPEEELIRALFVASLPAHRRLYRGALTHWRNPGHLRFPTFRWRQLRPTAEISSRHTPCAVRQGARRVPASSGKTFPAARPNKEGGIPFTGIAASITQNLHPKPEIASIT